MSDEATHHDRLDQAVRNRLAKLRQMPVDSSRLENRLTASMAAPAPAPPQRPAIAGRITKIRRVLAVAAAVALVTSMAAMLLTVGQTPAVASPADLARVHRSLLDDAFDNMHVENAEQANRMIAEQWSQAPQVPTPAAGPISACCVDVVSDTRVVCARLQHRGKAVTMVVAHSSQMHCRPGEKVERAGRMFDVHQADGLTMVMTMRDDRCVCLVSELDAEALLELALQLRFD
jgi:hypothetical protein